MLDGRLYYSAGDSAHVEVITLGADVVGSFSVPLATREVTSELIRVDKARVLRDWEGRMTAERLAESLRHRYYPKRTPAITRLVADASSGMLWARGYAHPSLDDSVMWIGVDTSGVPRRALRLPSDVAVYQIQSGHVVGHRVLGNGAPVVVVYEMAQPGA